MGEEWPLHSEGGITGWMSSTGSWRTSRSGTWRILSTSSPRSGGRWSTACSVDLRRGPYRRVLHAAVRGARRQEAESIRGLGRKGLVWSREKGPLDQAKKLVDEGFVPREGTRSLQSTFAADPIEEYPMQQSEELAAIGRGVCCGRVHREHGRRVHPPRSKVFDGERLMRPSRRTLSRSTPCSICSTRRRSSSKKAACRRRCSTARGSCDLRGGPYRGVLHAASARPGEEARRRRLRD